MSYKDDELTGYTSTWKPCLHHTGWYFIVKFWIFKKRLYWCDLCHETLPDLRKRFKK